jgi:hypothetical protein
MMKSKMRTAVVAAVVLCFAILSAGCWRDPKPGTPEAALGGHEHGGTLEDLDRYFLEFALAARWHR